MKPQPQPVHEGDAVGAKPASNNRRRDTITAVCEIALITLMIVTPCYYLFYDLPPEFSVQLAPIGNGLDMAAPAASISPAFHVALHAANRRATERCYRDGEAVVTFAGFTIASGRVPGFCVLRKGRQEVPFLARADGVVWPDHLRDRMAAAYKVGALELEVQVRVFHGGNNNAASSLSGKKPMWMWCKVRMTTGGAQRTDVTTCTVFAPQNWFVDALLETLKSTFKHESC
ncbi:hypothetical protein QOZ80_1BG0080870 [Eleusine coracana subsp. coracana]|nr:hypothetical protein QOZ80_1BG0080870 [Eleusine coracana subsp. coracana]